MKMVESQDDARGSGSQTNLASSSQMLAKEQPRPIRLLADKCA